MTTAAALQLALAMLPMVTAGVQELIAWINSLKTSLQQADEWTVDQETAYRAALFAKTNDPAYKPDA